VRFRTGAVHLSNRLGTLVYLAHPDVDEPAYTWPSIVKPARQDGGYAAAFLMTHDHDLTNIKLIHAILDGCRDAVSSTDRLEWRHKVGNISNDEDVARIGIKNARWIGTAVATGDNHGAGRLALG